MPYVLLGMLLGALLSTWFARAWASARRSRINRRARQGELAAERLLKREGYVILDQQVCRRHSMLIDKQRVEYEVRADLLASKRGRTYVVEVKTGKSAPDPKKAATRRQLREYAAIYKADGLLLADMTAERLHAIEFPAKETRPSRARMATVFLIGAIVGVILTMLTGG